jgi:hypothetical protein
VKLSDLIPFRKKQPVQKSWTHTSEGMLSKDWDWGWWQQDLQPGSIPTNETVEACVAALSQTVSMCPAHHISHEESGEARRKTGSYVERVLLNHQGW